MNQNTLEQNLLSIENLPSLPVVINHLYKVMNNPKTSMAQIAAVIMKDQALAAKVIRLVNSAYYGFSERVSSITRATVILGIKTIFNLMLGLSVIKLFSNKGMNNSFNHELFWKHAFGCAIIAKNIGEKIRYSEPEDCFIAGLLHDIGRLVLEQFMNIDFMIAYTNSIKNKSILRDEEKQIFGMDHSNAGFFLAQKWNLPESIASVLRYHHSLQSIPLSSMKDKVLITIVAKADQIVIKENIGSSGETFSAVDSDFHELRLSTEDVQTIIETAKTKIQSTIEEWRQ